MAQNAYLAAGSGSYQFVVSPTLAITAVPAGQVSVETYTPSSMANIPANVLCVAQLAAGSSVPAGLILLNSAITATGTLQLTWWNPTGSTITPGSLQVNVVVL